MKITDKQQQGKPEMTKVKCENDVCELYKDGFCSSDEIELDLGWDGMICRTHEKLISNRH